MAKLLVTSSALKGQAFNLEGEYYTIGRETDNNICLVHQSVSKHHAMITVDKGDFKLWDLHSTNGVLVNGQKTVLRHLKDGDHVTLGDVECVFSMNGIATAAKPLPQTETQRIMLTPPVSKPVLGTPSLEPKASTLFVAPTPIKSPALKTPNELKPPASPAPVADKPMVAPPPAPIETKPIGSLSPTPVKPADLSAKNEPRIVSAARKPVEPISIGTRETTQPLPQPISQPAPSAPVEPVLTQPPVGAASPPQLVQSDRADRDGGAAPTGDPLRIAPVAIEPKPIVTPAPAATTPVVIPPPLPIIQPIPAPPIPVPVPDVAESSAKTGASVPPPQPPSPLSIANVKSAPPVDSAPPKIPASKAETKEIVIPPVSTDAPKIKVTVDHQTRAPIAPAPSISEPPKPIAGPSGEATLKTPVAESGPAVETKPGKAATPSEPANAGRSESPHRGSRRLIYLIMFVMGLVLLVVGYGLNIPGCKFLGFVLTITGFICLTFAVRFNSIIAPPR